MTEIIMRKRAARAGEIGLFSVDDEGCELLAKIKDGRDVGCDVIQRRNPRHHRLWFAILQFVKLHATDKQGNSLFEHADVETISAAVKIATGYVRTFVEVDTGRMIAVPKSISWAACDQTEFNRFFENACNVICKRWLPEGSTADDVRRELIEMVDGPYALDERRTA